MFPLGLSAGDGQILRLLSDFDPTHVCASAANLVRWGMEIDTRGQSGTKRTAFVAGEKLTERRRSLVQNLWNSDVINVYGMAEFDMVASELPGANGLCLVPHLEYHLDIDGQERPTPLSVGQTGQLLIARDLHSEWHPTGDRVEVVDERDHWGCGRPTFSLHFLERLDGAGTFSDGCMLSPAHLSSVLLAEPTVEFLQAVITRQSSGDTLEFLFVERDGGRQDDTLATRVRDAVLLSAVDVRDAFNHRCITNVTARAVDSAALYRTPRGKTPAIWTIEVEDAAC